MSNSFESSCFLVMANIDLQVIPEDEELVQEQKIIGECGIPQGYVVVCDRSFWARVPGLKKLDFELYTKPQNGGVSDYICVYRKRSKLHLQAIVHTSLPIMKHTSPWHCYYPQ